MYWVVDNIAIHITNTITIVLLSAPKTKAIIEQINPTAPIAILV